MSTGKIKGLVLEGGGVAGVAHTGVLEQLDNDHILDGITHFAGSSAGSIVAAALACKIDIASVKEILYNTDFNTFKDDSYGFVMDVWRLCREFGWYKGDALEEWFGGILEKHTGSADITFKEAYEKYGTYLVITMTDINLGSTVYVDHFTHPDDNIKTIVRRSSSIPIFFKADSQVLPTEILEEDGKLVTKSLRHYFVDGGLMDNYPIDSLYKQLEKDEVVGIKLLTNTQLSEMNNPHVTVDRQPHRDPISFIMCLITMLRNQLLKTHINEDDWKRTIKVDIGNVSATDFNISDDVKDTLMEQGRQAAIEFFNLQ
jgi:NTE family protein